MELENGEGGGEGCGGVHAQEKFSASYKDERVVWVKKTNRDHIYFIIKSEFGYLKNLS